MEIYALRFLMLAGCVSQMILVMKLVGLVIILIFMKFLAINLKIYLGSFANMKMNRCIFTVRVFL